MTAGTTWHATGANLLAGVESRQSGDTFRAVAPETGRPRELAFSEATVAEIDRAVLHAVDAFRSTRTVPDAARADLMDAMAQELDDLGDELLDVAAAESGLPHSRLVSERTRTTEQMRSFAWLLREGWYVDAMIDTPDAGALPVPRPDVRRMLVPFGPVAVFGASNFPFAFSVPGGDTASALAAGCPVVVKGHPSHPETSELCGRAMSSAVRAVGLPAGMLSLIQGRTNDTGAHLVRHPGITAVGFTGSEAGGRALFDLATRRPIPIPVYAEMGSLNPVLITEGALAARADVIASSLVSSFLLGSGQFCTKPGVVLVPVGATGDRFAAAVTELVAASAPGRMLSTQIRDALRRRLGATEQIVGAAAVRRGLDEGPGISQQAAVVTIDGPTVLAHPTLLTEHFGPVSMLVRYSSDQELVELLEALPGGLTATVHAEPGDLEAVAAVLPVLLEKSGRLIWNGFPTGVSVTGAMNHGGPYPASTFPGHTSVGWTAIRRFLRPVTFQDIPEELLPMALRDGNPLNIVRLVTGRHSAQPVDPAGG